MNKIVLVDMDGVIAEFDQAWIKAYYSYYPEKTLPINKSKCGCYFEHPVWSDPTTNLEMYKVLYNYLNLFYILDPIPNALRSIKEMEKCGYTIFFCSHPTVENSTCASDKYEWLKKHFGLEYAKKLILTQDKTVIYGDYLIDDKVIIDGVNKNPSWKHLLFKTPYNSCICGYLHDKNLFTWENWKDFF